jgi:hypothetical protein
LLAAVFLAGCGLIPWQADAPPIDPLAQLEAQGEIDGVGWSYYVSVRGDSICEEIRFEHGAPAGSGCVSGDPAHPLELSELMQPGCTSGSNQPTFGHGRVQETVARVRILVGEATYEEDSLAAPDARYRSRFFVIAMPASAQCEAVTFVALDADGNELGRVGEPAA